MASAVRPPILILAGSPEAAALARDLSVRSDTGRLLIARLGDDAPPPYGGAEVSRIGGYRDPGDLAAEIGGHGVGAVIDASDPFDARASRLARAAADASGRPRLVLCRPVWPRHPLDRRIEVDGLDGAARIVADVARRVLLALPEAETRQFAARAGAAVACVARLRRGPVRPLEGVVGIDVDHGPYSVVGETRRLRRHGIGTVVLRATGCDRLAPLLAAARAADLPVIMIRRPWPVPGPRAGTVAEAIEWLDRVAGAGERGSSSRPARP